MLGRRCRPPLFAVFAVGLASLACDGEGGTGLDLGYLAFITSFEVAPGISPGETWSIDISETSGTRTTWTDTTLLIQPRDTVIFEAPVATYRVRLKGLPVACWSRDPLERLALLPEPQRTITMFYRVVCSSLLAIRTVTSGEPADSAYVYTVRGPGGAIQSGLARATDTIRIDDIESGTFEVELGHVADNCVITSDGGRRQKIDMVLGDQNGTQVALFLISCSDSRYRPEIIHVGTTYEDGRSVFYLEVTDPGAAGLVSGPDISAYEWDITDCDRKSIVEGGTVKRTGLNRVGARNRGADTVRIAAVVERAAIPEDGARCTALRVMDADGNTTEVRENRIRAPLGSPPRIQGFDAVVVNPESEPGIHFELKGSDPDGDLAGAYIQLLMSDGRVLGRGVEGHLGTTIPDLLLGPFGLEVDDITGFRVILMDREGAFATAEDLDLLN